ncbi:hypothetical protein EMIT079MI2_150099 [Bacillus sp. IT-79MI2]
MLTLIFLINHKSYVTRLFIFYITSSRDKHNGIEAIISIIQNSCLN